MEHSRFGYSAVSDFKSCPFKYFLNWVQHLEVIPEDDPTNALYIGTALHKAIETDIETAQNEYFENFNIISDQAITEIMKVEVQANKVKKLLENADVVHETRIEYDDFIGTIDLLEDLGDGHYNMYDFKYTNNWKNYVDSLQLTIYKHFFELTHPGKQIDKMYFIIIPKATAKMLSGEDIQSYRRRICSELGSPTFIESKFSKTKLLDYFVNVEVIKNTTVFAKKQNQFCNWCKYNKYCMKGDNTMLLPSTNRRPVGQVTRKKIWIYGAAMSGKTTLVDEAPTPLNLNTDGNIQFVSMPFVPIKNDVKVEGRITKTTLAWEIFKDTIAELEKKQNDFKTIVVDLLEDTYEHCRLYMYDKLGITHESDDTFRAWDKVRTEYLSTIRRLMNLDYENIILLSHEDMSKDITKKSGDKVTAIKPNIPDKVANKIAGMVDIVARVVVEDDGSRTLNFKSNEVIFGGGRLKGITNTSIPLNWEELMNVYANVSKASEGAQKASEKAPKTSRSSRIVPEEVAPVPEVIDSAPAVELEDEGPFEITDDKEASPVVEPTPAEPRRRARRVRE